MLGVSDPSACISKDFAILSPDYYTLSELEREASSVPGAWVCSPQGSLVVCRLISQALL